MMGRFIIEKILRRITNVTSLTNHAGTRLCVTNVEIIDYIL